MSTEEREQAARAAFEEVLAVYMALPEGSFGKMVLHFGADGVQCKPGLEVGLPAILVRGGPQVAVLPARVRMPSNAPRR